MTQEYQQWIGKYTNKKFNYFAKHQSGRPIEYNFNNTGYRGPDHSDTPDISVFGSSFSFGVGIEFNQCWHQLLGKYQINCYAPAGILMTNNDIIKHYHSTPIVSGIVILQFREAKYNCKPVYTPTNVLAFAIDNQKRIDIPCFTYHSFKDRAEDQIHPGPDTHKLWAQLLKKTFNL